MDSFVYLVPMDKSGIPTVTAAHVHKEPAGTETVALLALQVKYGAESQADASVPKDLTGTVNNA